MKSPWPIKPVLVLATFGVMITLPQYIPQWYNWRIYEWAAAPAVLDFQPRTRAESPLQEEMERMKPDTASLKRDEAKIVDTAGAMEGFYAALLKTERQQSGAVTRILHYGDSPVTADLITADVRNFMQQRFGDAGHGTYLIAKPWAWYGHRGLEVSAEGWTMNPATLKGERDGRYGLGGVSFTGQTGAWSRIRLKKPGHTSMKVLYLGRPEGGEVTIDSGDVHIGTLDTSLPEAAAVEQSFDIPAEATEFTLKVTRGSARLFAVEFHKAAAGVMYDSLGLNGTWAGVLASHMNGEHWIEELRLAKPNLVVINYGTNESGYRNYIETSYPKDMKEILRRVRTALPDASILVMSPMDRGAREAGGTIGTVASLPQLVAVQSKLAAENHCAFFNTFQAMGGPGTMGRWYMAEPRLVSADFIHPLPSGARIVGTLLYNALMDGYNAYKQRLLRQTLAAAATDTKAKRP